MSFTPQRSFIDKAEDLRCLPAGEPAIMSIVGPTGSGKTRTALQLADELGRDRTLLVSVDSVALYRELDVGSAKPLGDEREGYEWTGLDWLELSDVATSSKFVERVLPIIEAALHNKKHVILVGGSHFYERSLAIGRMPGEASDPIYQSMLSDQSNETLHARLLGFDKRFGEKILLPDRYRITRYLDLVERQGLGYEDLLSPHDRRPWRTVYTFATHANEDLALRTAQLKLRVESMFKRGWVEEISALLERGADPLSPGLQTIGYRDVSLYVRGVLSFEETFERVLISHRQLAKVQRTWVRGLLKKGSLD
ncbi:MAG TPA: tRNA (adenosine(37)-N6)-dimethylallyltransferase MiaA [Bdellovibrionota bacterium]|jgi:tRNA dimethylallyltransferase|nr:tRNA (adenosine(37)-N6)-dimethylallyltransferase MiaA [Bdellovibrionota bacterium]